MYLHCNMICSTSLRITQKMKYVVKIETTEIKVLGTNEGNETTSHRYLLI